MLEALDVLGNPSSIHAEGRRARAVVEEARAAPSPRSPASSRAPSCLFPAALKPPIWR